METEALEASMHEIKANKQPIGKVDNPIPFASHIIPNAEGTIFYLFTDGFADQFGGEKGKKFKYKQLKQILQNNFHLPFKEQEVLLKKTFEIWQGKLEQVDDVCIIGFRL
ncbi:MAG: SpoIIE family protein phosphatase [Bacteroidetes bacterium]|nr:SpoIIE family protein phosphatase [Bacteroidota bacterium]